MNVCHLLHRCLERVRPRLYLWAALVIALPRVVFLVALPDRDVYGNAEWLLILADNLAAGRGFLGEDGQPEGYFGPVYVSFLAAARVLGGEASLLLIKLGHIAFDLTTGLILCRLMSPYFSAAGVLVFALAFGFHPLPIHYANNINIEPLFTLLVTVSFAAFVLALRKVSPGWLVAAGAVSALATLTKGTAILLPGLVSAVACIVIRRSPRRALGCAALILITYSILLVPWSYRNYLAFGRFTPTGGGLGSNMWWGSDPKIFASYGAEQRRAAARTFGEMQAQGVIPARKAGVLEREKWYFEIARHNYREMLRRPAMLAKVVAMKATRTLYATEDRPSAHVWIVLIQGPIWLVALVGARRLWRRSRPTIYLLIAFVGYFYLVVAAGMPIIRYFVPALPLLLTAATAGVHRSMLRES